MNAEEFIEAMKSEKIYSLLCAAEEHFRSSFPYGEHREAFAHCYAIIVSGRRVLQHRGLIEMNVEQFQQNHPSWYADISRALIEALDHQGFSYNSDHKKV